MGKLRLLFLTVTFLISLFWSCQPDQGLCGTAESGGWIMIIELEGAINPGTAMYVIRGIETAKEEGAAIAIIRLDTPGGLATSMRSIIKAILNSEGGGGGLGRRDGYSGRSCGGHGRRDEYRGGPSGDCGRQRH
jgi:membrane-bound ClpP family serine protease